MDHTIDVIGEHGVHCSKFFVRATVDSAPEGVDDPRLGWVELSSKGPEDDGCVVLTSNGRVACEVAQTSIDLMSDGIVMDAGPEGNIGLRAGTPPLIQSVDLEGDGGSIKLCNGQLPIAPTIEITEESIELSVGPNKLTIDATGIRLQGLTVAIEGEATAEMSALEVSVEGTVAASLSGLTAELQGEAEASVKGAMVMIN